MTTDTRAAFEAWFSKNVHTRLSRNMPDASYNDPAAHSAFEVWLAATLAERERRAAVCESMFKGTNGFFGHTQECADKIRSGE